MEKYLLEKLNSFDSAVGDSNVKGVSHIEVFPPAFQAILWNPIVLDLAYNFIEFPSLESRMKKEKKDCLECKQNLKERRIFGLITLLN